MFDRSEKDWIKSVPIKRFQVLSAFQDIIHIFVEWMEKKRKLIDMCPFGR